MLKNYNWFCASRIFISDFFTKTKAPIVTALILLLVTSTSVATKVGPYKYLNRDKITYELSGPSPFQEVQVVLYLKRSNILRVEVDVNGTLYTLSAQELGLDYWPQIDDLNFFYDRWAERSGGIETVKFRIPYDRQEYVDCGDEGRTGYFKQREIIIYAFSKPEVIDERTIEQKCMQKDRDLYPRGPLYGEE